MHLDLRMRLAKAIGLRFRNRRLGIFVTFGEHFESIPSSMMQKAIGVPPALVLLAGYCCVRRKL